MGRASVLPYNYPHLQNLIKRDPNSYEQEFEQQYQHFKASLAIVRLRPSAADDHFESLVTFVSHVASLYLESKKEFPGLIVDLLEREAASMNASLRRTLVQSLLLLRKHKLFEIVPLLELFFKLFKIQDKALREQLYESIIGEVRRANRPHKNNSLNKSLQNFMYSLFEENNSRLGGGIEESLATDKILQIIIELYRKGVWDDSRTVNIVADAAIRHKSPKVMNTALNFFIGRFRGKALNTNGQTGDDNSEESDNNEGEDYQKMMIRSSISGTNKRSMEKKLKKALNSMHRKEGKTLNSDQNGSFSAIHLLNDPQGFVEKLMSYLRRSTDTFDMKLLMMNVISRTIGSHKLLLLDFHSFLLRYIQPQQKEVTQILAYAAQATHDLVPADVMEPLVTAIAHSFVAEHCANEVIAAGLNGLREICSRCPLAISTDLLQDLAGFKGYRDKGVVMAARSLISLYREIDPAMLHRKDRGKEVSISMKNGAGPKSKAYGETRMIHLNASNLVKSAETGAEVETETNEKDQLLEPLHQDSDFEQSQDSDFEQSQNSDFEQSQDSDFEQADFESVQAAKPVNNDIVRLATLKVLDPSEILRLRKRLAGEMDNDDDSSDNEDLQSDSDNNNDEIVNPESLQSIKKSKQDYEQRMSSIMAGRQGRLKFGSKKGKHNANASSSNRVKSKQNKNAIMMAHKSSVRAKKRRSLKEKQLSVNKHNKRQKMRR